MSLSFRCYCSSRLGVFVVFSRIVRTAILHPIQFSLVFSSVQLPARLLLFAVITPSPAPSAVSFSSIETRSSDTTGTRTTGERPHVPINLVPSLVGDFACMGILARLWPLRGFSPWSREKSLTGFLASSAGCLAVNKRYLRRSDLRITNHDI